MILYIVCIITTLAACVIGKICGMGGGVIIKPVLDALHIAEPAAVNFMSGCTVIGMSAWSVGKSFIKKDSRVDLKISTPLGIGAAIGGILGKYLFKVAAGMFTNAGSAGGVQALVLFLATAATLVYTIRKDRVPSYHCTNAFVCILIGLCLGLMSSFLGIGGGPFNVAVLFFFFSMDAIVAVQNSLYIILLSQIAGMLSLVFDKSIPAVNPTLLLAMILCGIAGSEIGGRLNKRLNNDKVTRLFEGSMILVMCICMYNIFSYFSL